MTLERHILLAGLRGSGKSTLGRLLAERLGAAHVDLDDRTARLLGTESCAEALTELGEPAFRAAEARALEQVLGEPACVVSLGGGSPAAPGATEYIADSPAQFIYLRLAPRTLADRLAATDLRNRPSLTGQGVIEEIRTLYDARDPLYLTLGQTLDIDHEPVEQSLARLIKLVNA